VGSRVHALGYWWGVFECVCVCVWALTYSWKRGVVAVCVRCMFV